MKTLYMTKGLPGSGKTTWAKAHLDSAPKAAVTRVNKDDLRDMMHSGQWSKHNERIVLAARDGIIIEALAAGQHVICDDTNLAPKHETRLRELATAHGARFELVDFTDVPLDDCLARNANRTDKPPVPPKAIRDMWKRYIWTPLVVPEYDRSLPRCVIVDVDGTLAHMNGRSPYDWDRVGEDTLDDLVAFACSMFAERGYAVVLLSGRDGSCRGDTVAWLETNAVTFDELHMRAAGDNRKDSVVKRELFEAHIVGRYYPELVIDDRRQVVDMWRNELGLTVWQVAAGDF